MYTLKPMWDLRSGPLESMAGIGCEEKVTNGPTIKRVMLWCHGYRVHW